MDYCSRTAEGFIRSASAQFPAVLVVGARQVGKTTVLRHLAEAGRTYVTLDDPTALALARTEPGLFLQRFRPPVLIDEIQYAPELMPFIKMQVDRERTSGSFWLTGSQHLHVMKEISESLAGRVAVVSLLGMSQSELTGCPQRTAPFLPLPEEIAKRREVTGVGDLDATFQAIFRGGLPGISLAPEVDRNLFFGSYVRTYLLRDVRDLAQVGNEMAFHRFLRAAAARTACLLNVSEMARDADVAVNTARHWLAILQATGLLHLVEPFHSNVTKRLVKAPKLYFHDTGLAAYLTEWSSPRTLEAGAMAGAFFETFVVGELLKGYVHNGRPVALHYYRDRDGKEIDLLVEADGMLYPLEIKKTGLPKVADVRHFSALDRLRLPVGPGALICLVHQSIPLTDRVTAVPVGAL